jgi:hypothetical protein
VHAVIGDRVVVAGAKLGAPVRDGEIVEVHGQNGEPPYLVRWSDSGRESLFFPGPDSHIEAPGDEGTGSPASEPSGEPQSAGQVRNWHVDLYVYEGAESTTAHAVLHGASQKLLDSRGAARLRPGEANVPEIGDELAVARALRGLADRLLAAASDDVSTREGRAVHLQA